MASVGSVRVLLDNGRLFHRFARKGFTYRHPASSSHVCLRHLASGSSDDRAVRIGCASGFWGDTAVSAPQLIHKGNLDFLVFDYLSEITMSLLSAAKQKFPEMGYAPDFVQVAIGPYLKDIKQKGIRVVSNAGGINPHSCASALRNAAKKADVDLKIATVTGDDLMSHMEKIASIGVSDIDSGRSFPPKVTSMTAYLGGGPIQQALDMGADIVVTGRCTDSALVLGPLMHTFKWGPTEFDLLAAGSLAGHLIECGAQATGGIFTDWETVPDWHNIGFPVAEVASDGVITITKPPGTGGLVTPAVLSEQLVYEIGDPASYILPDVTCDFTNVKMEVVKDQESVRVYGAVGRPPTDSYKVSSTYAEGYRLTAVSVVGGPKASAKGRCTAQAIVKRCQGIFKMMGLADFKKVNIQALGSEDTYGPHAATGDGPREAVLWLAAHHENKKALEILSREIAPAGTGMAPGLTAIVGGRPKVSPVLKLFSYLYPKKEVKIEVTVDSETQVYQENVVEESQTSERENQPSPDSDRTALLSGSHTYKLADLAYTRSGDKGNKGNIGVIARHPSYIPYLRQKLTPEVVDSYMAHVFEDRSGEVSSRVQRFELPGIHGFNFLLHDALGGGGITSLRSDPQGKAFGQMLLDLTFDNMPTLKEIQSIQ